jgi:hypothetical protein
MFDWMGLHALPSLCHHLFHFVQGIGDSVAKAVRGFIVLLCKLCSKRTKILQSPVWLTSHYSVLSSFFSPFRAQNDSSVKVKDGIGYVQHCRLVEANPCVFS